MFGAYVHCTAYCFIWLLYRVLLLLTAEQVCACCYICCVWQYAFYTYCYRVLGAYSGILHIIPLVDYLVNLGISWALGTVCICTAHAPASELSIIWMILYIIL